MLDSSLTLCSLPVVKLCLSSRSGNEEKLMALLTPLNVNCHASDGRKVSSKAAEVLGFRFFSGRGDADVSSSETPEPQSQSSLGREACSDGGVAVDERHHQSWCLSSPSLSPSFFCPAENLLHSPEPNTIFMPLFV